MAHGVGASTMPAPAGSVIGTRLWFVQDALNYVRWPPLHLVIDMSQVRPDNAQADELHPTQEQYEDDQRRETARHTARIDEPNDDLNHDRHEGHCNREEAEPRDQVERDIGEREDGLACPLYVSQERVRGAAEHPLRPHHELFLEKHTVGTPGHPLVLLC